MTCRPAKDMYAELNQRARSWITRGEGPVAVSSEMNILPIALPVQERAR